MQSQFVRGNRDCVLLDVLRLLSGIQPRHDRGSNLMMLLLSLTSGALVFGKMITLKRDY